MPDSCLGWRVVTLVAIVGLAMGLAGCTQVPRAPIDADRTQLMPESSAKKIISSMIPQYDGGSTLLAPYGDQAVPIRSIEAVLHTQANTILITGGGLLPPWVGFVCDGSREKAQQLAEALTALGASIRLSFDRNIFERCPGRR